MNVVTLLILEEHCDPYVQVFTTYRDALSHLYQFCLDELDKAEYPEFEDMHITDVIDIVKEDKNLEICIEDKTLPDPDIYQKGFVSGQQQMREQVSNLLRYTIHD